MTIFRAGAVLCWWHSQPLGFPVDHPVVDRHLWIEVAEYLIAVIGVILIAWALAEDFGSPLWGGLTNIRLR